MTDAITEIVYLPLKPNLNLESGEKKKVLDDTLDTIASQHGLKSLVWGRQIENPDMLEIVVGMQSPSPPPRAKSLLIHST